MNCVNHPDREKIAFCQNCGRALCTECSRTVGAAVFCEPCLEARLRAAGTAAPYTAPYTATGAAPGAPPVPPTPPPAGFGYRYVDPVTGMPVNRILSTHEANPWLAFGLGFIPGVGAMYNEQYAKGVVHLAVFAVLVSLADSHDIFGLFVAGWIFYMAIEAYHTARARRDGLPLPNPFGLNDIGERLGFGRAWGSTSTTSPASPAASAVPPAPAASAAAPAAAAQAAPPPADWSQTDWAKTDWAKTDWSKSSWSGVPPTSTGYYPPPPAPGTPMPGPLDVGVPHPGTRFPVGAIWLIGLGALFLIGNVGIFHGLLWFSGRTIMPLLLIGCGVWIFINRMTSGGRSLSDDGLGDYRYRLFRAAQGSSFVALTGVLFFLNDFDILSWGHSWPLWLILAGVMAILRRTIYAPVPMPVYPYVPPPVVPVAPVAPAAEPFVSSEPVAPAAPGNGFDEPTHPNTYPDQEGR